MPANNLPSDEDIIDLTELIESGEAATPARGAKAYSSVSQNLDPTDADVDFEDILKSAEKSTPSPSYPVDAHEHLDMSGMGDIDNLLESLDIPAAPGQGSTRKEASPVTEEAGSEDFTVAPKPQATAQEDDFGFAEDAGGDNGNFADLDSVLDDLLGEPPAQPTPKKQATEPVKKASMADDLPHDVSADLSADLDDILSAADEPSVPEEIIKEPETSEEIDTAFDLPADAASFPADEVSEKNDFGNASADDLLADLDGELESAETETVQPRQDSAGNIDIEADATEIVADEVESTDFLMEETSAGMQDGGEEAAQEETMVECTPPVVPQHVLPMQAQIYNPEELITGILKNILPTQNSVQEKLQEYARELGEQGGLLKSVTQQMEDLQRRLQAAETELANATSRIAVLENALKERAAFEEIFQDGSPLQKGFLELVTGSVAQAMESVNKKDNEIQVLEAHLDSLDAREKSVAERMDLLEKLVAGLRESFSQDVEKAAVKAVTTILHEEISRLMTES